MAFLSRVMDLYRHPGLLGKYRPCMNLTAPRHIIYENGRGRIKPPIKPVG